VSTDYNEIDRLYFEELYLECVLDIYERENTSDIIVSVGEQIPKNLARPLAVNDVNIIGIGAKDINELDKFHISQPLWSLSKNYGNAAKLVAKVKYPVLVRPSFILSGTAMRVTSLES